MNKVQKNRYTMYESVIAYLERNPSVFSDNEGFVDHLAKLKALNADLETFEDQQSKAKTGKVRNKTIHRNKVTKVALAVAGAIYAYARQNGLNILMDSVTFTKSKLDKFRADNLKIELRSIRQKAEEYREQITRYGITSAKLDGYIANIDDYVSAVHTSSNGRPVRTAAVRSLSEADTETRKHLKAIDRLVENYSDNMEFYTGYKSARRIQQLGIRYRKAVITPESSPPPVLPEGSQ